MHSPAPVGNARLCNSLDGLLAHHGFVDARDDAMLHQHFLKLVHGDRRWDHTLADIGVNLLSQSAIVVCLFRVRCVLDHRHAAKFRVLNNIGAGYKVDELASKLGSHVLSQLQLLVGLTLVANQAAEPDAA